MAGLPFAPIERAMLSAYARWAGGQAATPETSHQELHHVIGRFLKESKLPAPYRRDQSVAAFIRREFERGWREAMAGHPPAAPCGWVSLSTH